MTVRLNINLAHRVAENQTVGTIIHSSMYNPNNKEISLQERVLRKHFLERVRGAQILNVDLLEFVSIVNFVSEASNSIQLLETLALATTIETQVSVEPLEGSKSETTVGPGD